MLASYMICCCVSRFAVAGVDVEWDQALGTSKNTGIVSIAR